MENKNHIIIINGSPRRSKNCSKIIDNITKKLDDNCTVIDNGVSVLPVSSFTILTSTPCLSSALFNDLATNILNSNS